MEYNTKNTVLRQPAMWKNLYFYRKTDALYRMTVIFCERFLPKYGDRTVDQMIQAARSGKQNIIEGSEDGKTSTEMELKLLNVARASIHELKEDYIDYIKAHNLVLWDKQHPRFNKMLDYCKEHNDFEQYKDIAGKSSEEEFCNTAITLCMLTDKMMNTYIENLEKQFVTEGGIKERMHAARTGYRQAEMERLQFLEKEVVRLQEILKKNNIPF